jgi:tetratricopeptide (TPR) repeat protein
VSALRANGKLDEAIKEAQEVLVRRGGDPHALSELALAYLDKGELDTAELLVSEALKAKDSAIAQRTAGLVALERGDDAVAFHRFSRASELDPNDTTARLNMGAVLLNAGVYDRAEAQYRAVLKAKAQDIDAEVGLAAALRGQGSREKKGPYEEAARVLQGVLKRKPNHLAATYNLAVLYTDFLERRSEAKPLYQKFLELAPKNHPARKPAEAALGMLK